MSSRFRLQQSMQGIAGALVALWLLFLFLTAGHQAALAAETTVPGSSAAASYYTLTLKVDRSAVPAEVAFSELTLLVNTGGAEQVEVSTGDGLPFSATHDSAAGYLVLTTAADRVHLLFRNPQTPGSLGTTRKAILKFDRQWAWSHGMDDNFRLHASVDALNQRGYRGMLYLVGRYLSFDWDAEMLSPQEVQHYLEQGWSIGNHSWDHECWTTPAIMHQTIMSNYYRLRSLIDESNRPEYKVTAFAAPCADDSYMPVVDQIQAEGATNILFDETQYTDGSGQYRNFFRIIVDPDATDAPTWNTAVFTPGMAVGRYWDLDGSYSVAGDGNFTKTILDMDALVGETGPDRHFWFNTMTHGGEELALGMVADHVVANYGPGSTKPAWVAPVDEIFNYLLVRDNTAVTVAGPVEVVPAGFARATIGNGGDDVRLEFEAGVPVWYQIYRGSTPYFGDSSGTRLDSGRSAAASYTDVGALADTENDYYLMLSFRTAGSSTPSPVRAATFSFPLHSP